MHTITLSNHGLAVARFSCPAGLSVLRAALNAGLELSAGCMQGRCYTCRSTLLSGKVACNRPLSRYATIDPADLGESRVLLCSVRPETDVEVEPEGPWRIVDPHGTFELMAPESVPQWVE